MPVASEQGLRRRPRHWRGERQQWWPPWGSPWSPRLQDLGGRWSDITFHTCMSTLLKHSDQIHSVVSKDELSCKVLGPAVYTKIYCRVQRNQVLFIPVQWEKSGHTDHEANQGGSAVPHDNTELRQYRSQPGGCRRIPYIGSERKNSVRKTGERYKHCEEKSGSVALRPVEKSTAYGAFQPHTRAQTRVPGQWVGYSCAVPGCHNSVGQMSPGRTQLLIIITFSRIDTTSSY